MSANLEAGKSGRGEHLDRPPTTVLKFRDFAARKSRVKNWSEHRFVDSVYKSYFA